MPHEKPDDMAANLRTLREAAKLPDDAADVAADDQGISALARQLAKSGERPA